MNFATYQGRLYRPVQTPISGVVTDTQELADQGDRLMFKHTKFDEEPSLFIAPKGQVSSGHVLGLFME